MAQELTQERLKEVLHYAPETGVFTWKAQTSNRIRVGDVAGCTTHYGYRSIRVDGSRHRAHRLAYLYVHGEHPDGMLDHHDQDKGNNRISNLRPATKSQNALNTGLQANNTSGHKGVVWHKRDGKWLARITINKKHHHLGLFANVEEAVAARKAAEVTLGVSEFCPQ